MRLRSFLPFAALFLSLPLSAAPADTVFGFDTVASGTALPMSLTVSNVQATIAGSGAVCTSAAISGNMFATFSGNAVMQGFCDNSAAGPLTITFSHAIKAITFPVALNGTTPTTVKVTFSYQGKVISTQQVNTAVPSNSLSPEGKVTFVGLFDSMSLQSAGMLAVGALDTVPSQG